MENTQRTQKIIGLVFWLSIGVHLTSLALGKTLFSGWQFAHDPIHAIVEIVGSLVALYVAMVLLQQEQIRSGTSFNRTIALALIGMGVFDGLHAGFHAGKSFVFFHSFSTFWGGLIFSCVLLENKCPYLKSRGWFYGVLTCTLGISGFYLLQPDLIPAMVQGGQFTGAAVFLNMAGGILLLLAALKIFLVYRENKNVDDLLFVLHATLFGLAATMFQESKLWDFPWWSWHILRLGAYTTAFYFAYKQQAKLHFSLESAKQEKLAQASFLANMSHDIRTPLNGIMGMAELLKSDLKDKNNISKVDDLIKSSEILLRVVNDILDLSKINAGKLNLNLKPANLRQLLEHQESLSQSLLNGKPIQLKFQVDTQIPERVFVDEIRLQQILCNLISNAVKFTEKGFVSVAVSVVSSKSNRVTVRFEVTDTGIGIAKKDQTKLFKEFSQVDGSITRNFGGTGLGLSISKKLVNLFGGTIYLTSKKGAGTKISFEIPVEMATEQHQINPRQSLQSPPLDLSDVRILVTEDNSTNRKLVVGLIKKAKAQWIYEAENGSEALDLLERHRVDIVLMDFHMPVMDGIEATRNIIKIYGQNRPVIIGLSASTMTQDIDACLEAGMDEFMSKPVRKAGLYDVLAKYQYRKKDGQVA